MNSLQEVAIWQFRNTSHGSSSLLSPLASNQSLFYLSTPPPPPPPVSMLLSPVPISLPCSWPWVPSHAQLLPFSPQTCQRATLRGDCRAWNVGFRTMCLGFIWAGEAAFSGAETPKSPCLRIQMKCSKNWAKAPLWDRAALYRSAANSVFHHSANTVSGMLLTHSACFSCLIIFPTHQLIVDLIKRNCANCEIYPTHIPKAQDEDALLQQLIMSNQQLHTFKMIEKHKILIVKKLEPKFEQNYIIYIYNKFYFQLSWYFFVSTG